MSAAVVGWLSNVPPPLSAANGSSSFCLRPNTMGTVTATAPAHSLGSVSHCSGAAPGSAVTIHPPVDQEPRDRDRRRENQVRIALMHRLADGLEREPLDELE